jgi:TDG/mug DNA glycosylase family protein
MLESFAPIHRPDSKILILGTGPSVVSLQKGEYYGFARNAFWPILSDVFAHPIDTYDQKVELALVSKLALWNVLFRFEREGSLDSNYRSVVPNALIPFIDEHPALEKIIFNGKQAARFYDRLVAYRPSSMQFFTLASTSPANTMRYEDKLVQWRAALAE